MTTPIRAALFVDFDQVFSGLYRERPDAAERFAVQPEDWLRYLEEGQHDPARDEAGAPLRRSILLRRCYLNPVGAVRPAETGKLVQIFSRYRAYFTRAAFSVIDCPPLTAHAKNSADIVMVMDILDALEHRTRFDEFIILSGDADFAPVLMRLRAHDRRTTILTDLRTVRAYRAASDLLIRQEDFIGIAMGLAPDARMPPAVTATATPATSELRQQIIATVRTLLGRSDSPVPLATLAQEVRNRIKAVEAGDWPDGVKFSALLRGAQDPRIALANHGGGYAYDPQRHPQPDEPAASGAVAAPEPAAAAPTPGPHEALASALHRVTGMAMLPAESYRALFRHLAAILRAAGLGRAVSQSMLAAIVHERCAAESQVVPREAVGFVLATLPPDPSIPADAAPERWLAEQFRDAVRANCAAAGLTLSETEAVLMDAWLVGVEAQAQAQA